MGKSALDCSLDSDFGGHRENFQLLKLHSFPSTRFLVELVSASLLLNGFLGTRYVRIQQCPQIQHHEAEKSPFGKYRAVHTGMSINRLIQILAGLVRDIPVSWTHHTPFTGQEGNQTEADRSWDNISVDAGSVALSDSYSRSMGLPEAQRFPWDTSKGLYLLNGYHNLHCLVCAGST